MRPRSRAVTFTMKISTVKGDLLRPAVGTVTDAAVAATFSLAALVDVSRVVCIEDADSVRVHLRG